MLYRINWSMLTKESITFTDGDRSYEGCCGRIHLQKDEQKGKDSVRQPNEHEKALCIAIRGVQLCAHVQRKE